MVTVYLQVYVILVGQVPPQPEVMDMCSYPPGKHFFQLPDYDKLKDLEDRLIELLCDGRFLKMDWSKALEKKNLFPIIIILLSRTSLCGQVIEASLDVFVHLIRFQLSSSTENKSSLIFKER